MSIVCCKILGDGEYDMASDSIMVRGYTQSKGNTAYYAKMMEVNDLVIGSIDFAEESSLLFLFATKHKPKSATLQGLLDFIGEFADWKKNKTDKAGIVNSYLIGMSGKVFMIEGWFISEVNKYEAIGAGMDYALSALHLGHTAEEAVKIATELSVYCEPPIIVISKRKEPSR